MSKLMKTWIYILYTIMSLVMIIGFIYMAIQVGYAYITVYTEVGLKGMLLSFIIGLVFYTIMFYGIYKLDLKVRKAINDNNTK